MASNPEIVIPEFDKSDHLDQTGQFSGRQIDRLTKPKQTSFPTTPNNEKLAVLSDILSPEQIAFNREHNLPLSSTPIEHPDPRNRRTERSSRYVPPRRRKP